MPHPVPSPELPPIDRLRRIMHLLRAPGGCPWDAEQTHASLVKHLLEEAYEVAEAIQSGDKEAIVDELGDLLLQPVFHAEIAAERGDFTFDDIATAISEKLIRRHPHVFGEAVADDPEAVLRQWEEIKAGERGGTASAADDAPVAKPRHLAKANEGLPGLMAAQKIQKKAAGVGFDWAELAPVLDKIQEELDEVREALVEPRGETGVGDDLRNPAERDAAVAEEIGDLLFAVVNLARKTGHEAEILLHRANRKFVKRFQAVEDALEDRGVSLESATLKEMDAAWNEVKGGE